MKKSAFATIIYFFLTLVYKLYGDPENISHTNLYWLYSSAVFTSILLNIRENTAVKLYRRIFYAASLYWRIMGLLHFYCIFDIEYYKKLNVANKFTVGAISILLLLIYLTSTLLSYDTRRTKQSINNIIKLINKRFGRAFRVLDRFKKRS